MMRRIGVQALIFWGCLTLSAFAQQRSDLPAHVVIVHPVYFQANEQQTNDIISQLLLAAEDRAEFRVYFIDRSGGWNTDSVFQWRRSQGEDLQERELRNWWERARKRTYTNPLPWSIRHTQSFVSTLLSAEKGQLSSLELTLLLDDKIVKDGSFALVGYRSDGCFHAVAGDEQLTERLHVGFASFANGLLTERSPHFAELRGLALAAGAAQKGTPAVVDFISPSCMPRRVSLSPEPPSAQTSAAECQTAERILNLGQCTPLPDAAQKEELTKKGEDFVGRFQTWKAGASSSANLSELRLWRRDADLARKGLQDLIGEAQDKGFQSLSQSLEQHLPLADDAIKAIEEQIATLETVMSDALSEAKQIADQAERDLKSLQQEASDAASSAEIERILQKVLSLQGAMPDRRARVAAHSRHARNPAFQMAIDKIDEVSRGVDEQVRVLQTQKNRFSQQEEENEIMRLSAAPRAFLQDLSARISLAQDPKELQSLETQAQEAGTNLEALAQRAQGANLVALAQELEESARSARRAVGEIGKQRATLNQHMADMEALETDVAGLEQSISPAIAPADIEARLDQALVLQSRFKDLQARVISGGQSAAGQGMMGRFASASGRLKELEQDLLRRRSDLQGMEQQLKEEVGNLEREAHALLDNVRSGVFRRPEEESAVMGRIDAIRSSMQAPTAMVEQNHLTDLTRNELKGSLERIEDALREIGNLFQAPSWPPPFPVPQGSAASPPSPSLPSGQIHQVQPPLPLPAPLRSPPSPGIPLPPSGQNHQVQQLMPFSSPPNNRYNPTSSQVAIISAPISENNAAIAKGNLQDIIEIRTEFSDLSRNNINELNELLIAAKKSRDNIIYIHSLSKNDLLNFGGQEYESINLKIESYLNEAEIHIKYMEMYVQ